MAGLLSDPARLAAMTTAAARVGHRDAARQVAQAALDIARHGHPAVAGRTTVNTEQLPPELQRVHMVGIGGAGMSGIARILLDRGALVSGSDAKESRGVHALRARGALIRIGHDASSLDLLPGGPTAVITTHAAIPKTNPELVEARRRGIPVILRPAVLAKLMDGRTTLMVTGTHGKTTTTSMLIVALQHCGRDPSFAVGGELGEAGTNAHHGSGDCFVAEADESDGSLLEYTPNVAVVTNIEADHLDFYGSADAYVGVFDAFVERLAPGGALVVVHRRPGRGRAGGTHRRAGNPGAALRIRAGPKTTAATLLSWEQQGTEAVAHIQLAGEPHPRVMRLSVPGRHMALNALGALLAAIEIGASADAVLDGLAGFEGVRRRFELVGERPASVRVFDDYAHHPTEISATLAAVRTVLEQSGGGRCIVVFQPHLYSRTKAFAAEFGRALDAADEVFVLDVYGARETTARRCQRRQRRRARQRAGALRAGLLRGRRAGGRGRGARRRHRHDGRGRRDHAGTGDRDRAAGPGQPQRARPAGSVAMTQPNDATPTDAADGRAGTGGRAVDAATARHRAALRRGPQAETPADDDEFEGPRRRARRERAERRAAQARAVAIEEARREAKRRASGRLVDEPKPVARGVVRGLKMLLVTVLLVDRRGRARRWSCISRPRCRPATSSSPAPGR